MNKLRVLSCKFGVAALAVLLSAPASATTLARQSGAFGIVTCDSIPVPPVTPTGILARQSGAFGIVTYDPVPLSSPVIAPESGRTFESSLTVTISCETPGAAIYYTTDGSEPTKDSTAYKRFKIYGKTTVKAVAYDAASDVYSEVTTAAEKAAMRFFKVVVEVP